MDTWLKMATGILAASTAGVLTMLTLSHRGARDAVLQTFAEQQLDQAEQAAAQIAELESLINSGATSAMWSTEVHWDDLPAANDQLRRFWPEVFALQVSLRPYSAMPQLGSLHMRRADCPDCMVSPQRYALHTFLQPTDSPPLELRVEVPLAALGERLGTTRQGSTVWWAERDSGILLATADTRWIGTDLRTAAGECSDDFETMLHGAVSGTASYCWPNEDGSVQERIAGYRVVRFFDQETIVGVSASSDAVLAPMARAQHATIAAGVLITGSAILLVLLGRLEFRERTRQERAGALNTISALNSALEARDPYTQFHSENVSIYGRELARRLGLSEEEQEAVQLAGLMHDIGKIGICDGILNKPGRLTDQEYAHIQEHAVLGEQILCHLHWAGELAAAVGAHHEKMDGSGYPRGLCGDEIPLHSRIIAVADVFDALITDRPYREGMPLEKAVGIIEEMCGSHLDPTVVAAFREDPVKLLRLGRGVRMSKPARLTA